MKVWPRPTTQAHAALRRSGMLIPSIRRGVVVVDGSGDDHAAGVGGWSLSPMGKLQHWSLRCRPGTASEVEVAACVYGVCRAMAHDPGANWLVYSDRRSVLAELAAADAPAAAVVSGWIFDGRVSISWARRDTEAVRIADALARSARLLPVSRVWPLARAQALIDELPMLTRQRPRGRCAAHPPQPAGGGRANTPATKDAFGEG